MHVAAPLLLLRSLTLLMLRCVIMVPCAQPHTATPILTAYINTAPARNRGRHPTRHIPMHAASAAESAGPVASAAQAAMQAIHGHGSPSICKRDSCTHIRSAAQHAMGSAEVGDGVRPSLHVHGGVYGRCASSCHCSAHAPCEATQGWPLSSSCITEGSLPVRVFRLWPGPGRDNGSVPAGCGHSIAHGRRRRHSGCVSISGPSPAQEGH